MKQKIVFNNFSLEDLLFKIKSMGYSRIFLESGVNLTSNFLKKNLVNDLSLFISKYKIGTFGLPNLKYTGPIWSAIAMVAAFVWL